MTTPIPTPVLAAPGPPAGPVLQVTDLVVEFPSRRGVVHAVSGVSFSLARGESLGIVGESGCGKSSTGRAIMQLPPPTSGSVALDGVELTALQGRRLVAARRRMQMIFQDPVSSLNPRRRVRDLVAEGLAIHERLGRDEVDARVDELLASVGLDPAAARGRRPFELSGGQCQRVSIARALALDPDVLLCDEAVSALDVSVQAQILNLLEAVRARFGLALVFVSHDLAVVRNVSDRIAVMYLGKLCEVAPTVGLFDETLHPYSRLLLDSVPSVGAEAPAGPVRTSELPSPLDPPSGCRFRTRCPRATDRCAQVEPALEEHRPGHLVACHHPLDPTARG